jgi:biopolymer transport protein ExbD
MARIESPRLRHRPRLEIIPFIDIIFFLLATFMMLSLSMIRNEAIPVHLPGAATSAPDERSHSVSISVSETGAYFYNQEEVLLPGIKDRLTALKASDADPKVFLNADAKVPFDAVVSLLDLTRQLGIAKVAIQTEKKTAPAP